MIAIKNMSKEDFKDRCDGKEYLIPKGKVLKVPDEAAMLWFGIGGTKEDIEQALRRRSKLDKPEWLNQFIQVKIREEIVEEPDNANQLANTG
jgi:hypothetical protein